MLRRTSLALLLAGALALPAAAQRLTVVNQGGASGDAQRSAIFEPFSRETGITIVTDTYNQELARLRSQVETGNLIWDVASVHSINEAAGCSEGLYERIDWSRHVPAASFAAVGGFGECGAPYLVSPGAMVYDADRFPGDAAPRSWADFWNVQKFPGRRGMVYQPDQTLEVALMADGVAPQDVPRVLTGPGGVDRAFRKLDELRPHIRWWRSGDESMQLLLTGEVTLGYAWQGRVNAANRSSNRNFRMVWEAGFTSSVIYLAVLKGSPQVDAAIRLVQYQLAAEPQARFTQILGAPPANIESYALIPPERRGQLPGQYADRGMMQAGSLYLNFWLDNGDAVRQRFARFLAQ
jgi:putative spermidine/putrescine transport system substrate-binding protein